MAAPPNRSPSPLSSRPNPYSRNSESNSTTRRSFSSNPFPRPSFLTNPRSLNLATPANSPAGFGRRNSVGKEGMGHLQSFDEKENDKDQSLKPMKVRSPANVSKNFMSPTISAASKFTPSPRKKVLVERNDPVRTSISFSEGIATFFSEITEDLVPKSVSFVNQEEDEGSKGSTVTSLEEKQAVLESPSASKTVKRVTFSGVISDSENEAQTNLETVTVDSDCVSVDSSSKNKTSCFSASPVIAPLDADPSVLPYDPKTNYLSPRAQFLHYKPKPRVEVLLNKEKGLDLGEAKRLEDSCTFDILSESFSDTDGTEESNYGDSQKDSEDSSSSEFEEPGQNEEELRVSESLPIDTPTTLEISDKIVEGKAKGKRRFLASLKCVSVLLVFLIAACISISVTDSDVLNSSMLNILNFSNLDETSRVADFGKVNFHEYAEKFKQLSFDSISHLSVLINNLGAGGILNHMIFVNLTDIQKDILVGGDLDDHQWSGKFTGKVGEDDFEEDEDAESELLEDKTSSEVAYDDMIPKESEIVSHLEGGQDDDLLEEKPLSEVASNDHDEKPPERENGWGTSEVHFIPIPQAQVNETQNLKMSWNHEGVASHIEIELLYELNSEDYMDAVSEDFEVKSEAKVPQTQNQKIGNDNFDGGMDCGYSAKVESSSEDLELKTTSNVIPSEMVEPLDGSRLESTFSAFYIAGLVSIFLALVSAAAFVHCKIGNASSNQNLMANSDHLLIKKMIASAILEQSDQVRPSSQNWATEDVVGESCPSEMSSFEKSSSRSRLRSANEVQNQEIKPTKFANKRESLASSSEYSMGSPSYGSFTTYENIPSKHARGDDEIMTPVRRSSRIRNHQVTSS